MKFNQSELKKTLKIEKLLFIYNTIKDIKKINILEFGVRSGVSTNMFLNICEKKSGSLLSIDTDDCGNLFKNKRWKFLRSRDDNFLFIKKHIKKKIDVIYIDSLHEPNHVKKILYYYYKFLKKDGYVFIDDICWLPYVKSSYRVNEFNEIINRRTFNKIIEIYFQNLKNINLEFSFNASGTAKLTKKNNKKLNEPKKIYNSEFGLKNIFRKALKKGLNKDQL